jgi:hypothetical protein
MSYDLYLYKRKDNPITEEEVAKHLTNNLPFNISESSRQWHYQNPQTDVYFLIDWAEPQSDYDNEYTDEPEELKDYVSLNFYVTINFARPSFFAYEIFPVLEQVLHPIDIWVLNPQGENVLPERWNSTNLQKSWTDNNVWAVGALSRDVDLKYLPLEKSGYVWSYQWHRQALIDSITEDIYVPDIFILDQNTNHQLCTAITWTSHIPTILPEVDFILMRKEYTRFFKKVTENGIIAYSEVIRQLKHYFEDFNHEVPHLKVLHQANADRMAKAFNALPMSKDMNLVGKLVKLDGFVDVKPAV